MKILTAVIIAFTCLQAQAMKRPETGKAHKESANRPQEIPKHVKNKLNEFNSLFKNDGAFSRVIGGEGFTMKVPKGLDRTQQEAWARNLETATRIIRDNSAQILKNENAAQVGELVRKMNEINQMSEFLTGRKKELESELTKEQAEAFETLITLTINMPNILASVMQGLAGRVNESGLTPDALLRTMNEITKLNVDISGEAVARVVDAVSGTLKENMTAKDLAKCRAA